MTTALAVAQDATEKNIYESLALRGDISALNPQDKAAYLQKLCESLGLNPFTQPFIPLKLNGKEILYASRGATDQLASIHKLNREIIKTERIEDVFVATCKVTAPDGRFDISTGAVTIGSLKGDNLANALMKTETKAKRRATLSFCGLGFLDETELETIPSNRIEYAQPPTKAQLVESIKTENKPEDNPLNKQLADLCGNLNKAFGTQVWTAKHLSEHARMLLDDESLQTYKTLDDERKNILIGDLQATLEERLAIMDANSADEEAAF